MILLSRSRFLETHKELKRMRDMITSSKMDKFSNFYKKINVLLFVLEKEAPFLLQILNGIVMSIKMKVDVMTRNAYVDCITAFPKWIPVLSPFLVQESS